jgi:hypothetical protein
MWCRQRYALHSVFHQWGAGMGRLSDTAGLRFITKLQKYCLLLICMTMFSAAQAQTVSISMPGTVTYQAGGQNLIVMSFTKTGAGGLTAPITLNFAPTQIGNQSWAVQSSPVGTTFVPVGIPNGTGNISFSVNFPATTPATVIIRIEIRNKFAASGSYTLTSTSGAVSASTTFNAGLPAKTECTIPGKDGAPATFNTANGIVNTYFGAPMDATLRTVPAGAHCLPIDTSNVAGANPGAATRLDDFVKGDLLLVYQTQGADIDATDSTNYGDGATPGGGDTVGGNVGGVTSLRQSGIYEFVLADGPINTAGADIRSNCVAGAGTAANPNVLPIAGTEALGGLINSYERQEDTLNSIRRNYQIVRVPQYLSMGFSGLGSVAALAWNGTIGGVLAVDVAGTINLGSGASTDKRFDADGRGFRGGAARIASGSGVSSTTFRSTTGALPNDAHGIKGESIAGTPSFIFDGISNVATGFNYLNGSNGRGAPGNGGGGGNACTASGNSEVSGGAGGANHGQGGNGGNCADPFNLVADTSLGGRRSSGLATSGQRLFFGGGGGAGAKTVASATNDASGGTGGGVVFVRANTINGIGAITANGTPGRPGSSLVNESGGGGGGAGGTLVVMANIGGGNVFTNTLITANGDAGGNAASAAPINNLNNTGPGGGGGGGRFFSTNLDNQLDGVIQTSSGARGGTTLNLTDFGANAGDVGAQNTALNSFTFAPGPRPGFICAGSTVPVTLSDVIASVENGQLVVSFGTASEAGTLGYRVFQNQLGNADFALGRGQITPAAGASVKPQRYEVRGVNLGAKEIWIEEVETTGRSNFYGPYPLNVQIGVQDIALATDWAAINAEQRAFRSLEARTLASRSSAAGVKAELKVSSDAWYRISFEQLVAAGADFSGVPSAQLRLMRGKTLIGVEVTGGATFGPGSALNFYGSAVKDSLYTDTAVYSLTTTGGAPQAAAFANAGQLTPATSHTHTVNFAPNRQYSFSSPSNDPWYATRVVRSANSSGLASEVVNISDRLASKNERMQVQLWGGTSFADVAGDHSVRISVNGVPVASAVFDGFTRNTIDIALPENVLHAGDNSVSMQLTPNAAAADVVYLESVAFSYQRTLKVQADGTLSFTASTSGAPNDQLFADNFDDAGASACSAADSGCQAFRVELNGPTARVFRVSNGQATALNGAKVKLVNGLPGLEFAGVLGAAEHYYVSQNSDSPSANVYADDGDILAGVGVNYLMITHPSFAAELAPLVNAREAEGLHVKVVNVESLYRQYSDAQLSPQAISTYLSAAKKTWPGLRYVLLVGGDSYDYKNYLGNSSVSFVPTQYRQTHEVVHFAPVDMAYSDVNADGAADLSVGRMPVRSAQELRNLVNKTLAYNQSGNARSVVWANDRDNNSYPFGAKSDAFVTQFPGWTNTRVDLNAFAFGASASASAALVDRINAGAAMVGYFGHSSPSSWTREALLSAVQVNQGGLFTNAAKPTTLVQLGCWGGYFVDPQYSSVAHALLLNPGGAAVVLASSGLTDVSNDELLASELLPKLHAGLSFGDAATQSSRAIQTTRASAIDVWLGTSVLGDPALKVNN